MSIFAADMKKSIRIAGVGLVMAVVCGGVYLNGLMPIITGYAAKNLASAVFVSGREAKDVSATNRFCPTAGRTTPADRPQTAATDTVHSSG